MILATPLPPTPGDVLIGVAAVLGGSLIAASSAFIARRSGNWLHLAGTVGGLLIVAGVVGQRNPVSGSGVGPWDSGITVPLLGLRFNPVAAVGVITCLAALVLGLLVERVPDPDRRPAALVHRPLEDDDSV